MLFMTRFFVVVVIPGESLTMTLPPVEEHTHGFAHPNSCILHFGKIIRCCREDGKGVCSMRTQAQLILFSFIIIYHPAIKTFYSNFSFHIPCLSAPREPFLPFLAVGLHFIPHLMRGGDAPADDHSALL